MRRSERGRAWLPLAWIATVVALVLGVAGLVLVDPGADTPADGGRLRTCQRRAGTTGSSTPTWRCTLQYEFREQTFTASVRRTSSTDPTGDRVDVYVDPSDPSSHSIGRPGSELRAIWLAVGGVGVAAAAALGGYHLWARRRSTWLPT